MIVRAIMFDEIRDGIGDFFVFGQRDHRLAADELKRRRTTSRRVVSFLLDLRATVVSSSTLPKRVASLDVARRRSYKRKHRRFSYLRCPRRPRRDTIFSDRDYSDRLDILPL